MSSQKGKIDRRAIKYKKRGWCQCCAKGRFFPEWLEENSGVGLDLDKDKAGNLFDTLIDVFINSPEEFENAVRVTTHEFTKKLNVDKLLESKWEGTAYSIVKFIEKNGKRIRELEKGKCQKNHSLAGVVIEYKQKTKPIEDQVTDLVSELGDMKTVAEEEEIKKLKGENAKLHEMLTKERKNSRDVNQEKRELAKKIKTLEEQLQMSRNSQSETDKLATECEKRNKIIEVEQDRNRMLEKRLQSYEHKFREINSLLPRSEESNTIKRVGEIVSRYNHLECEMIDHDEQIDYWKSEMINKDKQITHLKSSIKNIMKNAQVWKDKLKRLERMEEYMLAIFEGNNEVFM